MPNFMGFPVGNLTNLKFSTKGIDPTSNSSRLDASTLDLEPGSNRVYVDGLPDPGQGTGGTTTTITCSFLTASPPAAGQTYEFEGNDYVCTESEVEYAVGELVRGTATFVST